jgi:hypothetical protein
MIDDEGFDTCIELAFPALCDSTRAAVRVGFPRYGLMDVLKSPVVELVTKGVTNDSLVFPTCSESCFWY